MWGLANNISVYLARKYYEGSYLPKPTPTGPRVLVQNYYKEEASAVQELGTILADLGQPSLVQAMNTVHHSFGLSRGDNPLQYLLPGQFGWMPTTVLSDSLGYHPSRSFYSDMYCYARRTLVMTGGLPLLTPSLASTVRGSVHDRKLHFVNSIEPVDLSSRHSVLFDILPHLIPDCILTREIDPDGAIISEVPEEQRQQNLSISCMHILAMMGRYAIMRDPMPKLKTDYDALGYR
jgi:hypothetical protein